MTPITKTSQFPKAFMAARKYLRSLSGVNKSRGKIYATILIGHELPTKERQDCMREWARIIEDLGEPQISSQICSYLILSGYLATR
jgi:hypothetical protein